jgi:hypothetical protein
MKTISLLVNITFDSDISEDSQIKKVISNVQDGLIHEINDVGISPNYVDNDVIDIEIIHDITKTKLFHKF